MAIRSHPVARNAQEAKVNYNNGCDASIAC